MMMFVLSLRLWALISLRISAFFYPNTDIPNTKPRLTPDTAYP